MTWVSKYFVVALRKQQRHNLCFSTQKSIKLHQNKNTNKSHIVTVRFCVTLDELTAHTEENNYAYKCHKIWVANQKERVLRKHLCELGSVAMSISIAFHFFSAALDLWKRCKVSLRPWTAILSGGWKSSRANKNTQPTVCIVKHDTINIGITIMWSINKVII